jgi:reactive intermediate/imine deaminase
MLMPRHLTTLLLIIPGACQTPAAEPPPQPAETVEFFTSESLSDLPFSEGVRVGSMIYLSGSIGADPTTGQLATGGIAAETRQAMENIRASLERHGSSLDRVVKCLVMLADMTEWPAMNEVYVTFFPGPKPARSAMGANGLALGARVEIECMATVG